MEKYIPKETRQKPAFEAVLSLVLGSATSELELQRNANFEVDLFGTPGSMCPLRPSATTLRVLVDVCQTVLYFRGRSL